MIHTPFLSGNCKLAEADAFVICGYLMMCVYSESIFFQQCGDAMQKKTILKDAAGENYREMVRIQSSALIQRHAGECRHKAQGDCAPVCLPAQVFNDAGYYRAGIKNPQGILLIKCQRISQFLKRTICLVRCFHGRKGLHKGCAFSFIICMGAAEKQRACSVKEPSDTAGRR